MKLFLLLVGAVCLVYGGIDRRAANNQQLIQQLATASSKFSFDLYSKFASTNKNLIISPFSVFTALSMCSLGAKGNTMNEIYKTLNIDQTLGNNVHNAFKAYTDDLLSGLNNVTLNNANGMFYKPGIQLKDSFQTAMKDFYDAKAEQFDMANPKGPEYPINQWVSNQTAGMIPNFLAPGSIDDSTVMWLINAIYFKGTWQHVFDERMTRKRPFHVSSSVTKQVDMMSLGEKYFHYKRLDNLKTTILELPYIGNRYSLYILLPDAVDGLTALESGLDAATLENALQNMYTMDEFTVSLPKFNLSSDLDLKATLSQLGINQLFTDVADLTGFADVALKVDAVKQKAKIEVTEEGTRAAAVTGIGIVFATSVHFPRFFTVDRPFMFLIRDKADNSNLFLGRYSDPDSK